MALVGTMAAPAPKTTIKPGPLSNVGAIPHLTSKETLTADPELLGHSRVREVPGVAAPSESSARNHCGCGSDAEGGQARVSRVVERSQVRARLRRSQRVNGRSLTST